MDSTFSKWHRDFLEQAAEIFKAFGHPVRILILRILADGPSNVGGLVDKIDVPQAQVSQHLRILYSQKLISRRRFGNQVIYELAKEEVINIFHCLERCYVESRQDEQA